VGGSAGKQNLKNNLRNVHLQKGKKKQNRTSIPNTEIYDSQIKNPTKLQNFSLQNTPNKNKQMKIFPH
jgi:hypothetical protein